MRSLPAIAAAIVLALAPALVQAQAPYPEPDETPCSANNSAGCGASRRDLKQANRAYKLALKLQQRDPEEAFTQLEEAVRLVPRNRDYATSLELMRQHLVDKHLRTGNELAGQHRTVEASTEFQQVLAVDRDNPIAFQRLREMAALQPAPAPLFVVPAPEMLGITLNPKPVRLNFNQTMDTATALISTAGAFGLKANLDTSVPRRRVHFELKDADFFQAISVLCSLTNTFWVATSPTEITFAADTAAAHRQLDRWAARTFYLPEATSAQDLTDISNLLRTMFDLRFIQQQPASNSIIVRGPVPVLEAAAQVLENLEAGRPQIMLDFEAYQISRQYSHTVGFSLPLQFSIFSVPSSLISVLKQLVAAGTITSLNSSTVSAFSSYLSSSEYTLLQAMVQNPLATFGGGLTRFGISVSPLTVNAALSKSEATLLDRISVRANHGTDATFRLGTRYPILNTTYSAAYTITQATSSSSNLVPYPSFSYEDLGFTLKTKPTVQGNDVRLDLDMTIRSLTSESYNGLPVITQRAYKGVITVPDEESFVVAGFLSDSEQTSLSGVPGLMGLPIGNIVARNTVKTRDQEELLIVVTPHILRRPDMADSPLIKVPPAER
jgi:Flp pilus assembly secretin CpaC